MVVDEYYERYRRISHEELYRMLRAGSPARVAALAATWRSTQDTLAGLAAALRSDLDRLRSTWSGRASEEFQYRIGLIATYAQTLADESDAIRTGLTLMADALALAQRQAEQPETPLDAFAGVGVVGPELGMAMTDEERRRSYERVVLLVAQLSAEYGAADRGTWPAEVPVAPVDLPTSLATADGPGALATGLAGAVGPSSVGLSSVGPPPSVVVAAPALDHAVASPAVTATMSGGGGGASTVLSGLPGSHVVGHVVGHTGGSGSGGGGGGPAGSDGPVGSGPIVAGRLSEGQPVAPSDDQAWHSAETLDWHGDATTPPPVLGDD